MVKEKLFELLVEVTDVDPSTITNDTPFSELGMDSLEVQEVVMGLEEEFDIELSITPEVNTVGKLIDAIEALINEE